MSLEFDPSAGAVLYDAAGNVIWSSSRRQAYWTDYVSGSFSVPSISGSSALISTSNLTLEPVSSRATALMGWFIATSSSLSGIVNGGVHQLGGTTLLRVDFQGGNEPGLGPGMYPDGLDPRYASYTTSTRYNFAGCIAISTWVEAGFLRARVQRFKPLDGFSMSFSGMTVKYWAFALAFDN